MKTKLIPALVMLTAGCAVCIITLVNGYGLSFMIKSLFVVMLCFLVLGCIIKWVLDASCTKLEREMTAEDLGFADGEILEDVEVTEDEE